MYNKYKIEKTSSGKMKIISFPDLDDKEWKQISNWEDYYIHPSGFVKSKKINYHTRTRIKTTKERILSLFTVKGYLAVNFVKIENGKEIRKSVRVHRLVAEAFIPKVKGKYHINHIDGIKHNANINNLEWCTPSENEKHSFSVLGKISSSLKRRKFNMSQINTIRSKHKNGEKIASIARECNVDQSTIFAIVHNITYIKYLDDKYMK